MVNKRAGGGGSSRRGERGEVWRGIAGTPGGSVKWEARKKIAEGHTGCDGDLEGMRKGKRLTSKGGFVTISESGGGYDSITMRQCAFIVKKGEGNTAEVKTGTS